VREERLRDLGGLMLEMYRRDQFRQDLLVERCEELMALDDRLQELDTLLAAALSTRRVAPPARCTCGAPLTGGSHFCANCGRPVTATPPVVACANCGAAPALRCCAAVMTVILRGCLKTPAHAWRRRIYAVLRPRSAH
jgi:hypothetical protein